MPRLKPKHRWKAVWLTLAFFAAVIAIALALYYNGLLNGGP